MTKREQKIFKDNMDAIANLKKYGERSVYMANHKTVEAAIEWHRIPLRNLGQKNK